MSRRRRAPLAPLVPLLLTLVLGQAYAVEVRLTGNNGGPGAHGTAGTAENRQGKPGGGAPDLTYLLGPVGGGDLSLTLFGGIGGNGGQGYYDDVPVEDPGTARPGGVGGDGGAGGAVQGSVFASQRAGAALARVAAFGGAGGEGGGGSYDGACCARSAGNGGAGADASAIARAESFSDASATVLASATGGIGGAGGGGSYNGRGGDALASATGWSKAGLVSGNVSARGGAPGQPLDWLPWNQGGSPGNAVAMLSLRGTKAVAGDALAVSEGGTATATVELFGAGAAGTSSATTRGGLASSTMRAITSGALEVDVSARSFASGNNAAMAADVYVDSGYSMPAAGSAAVRGQAFAEGADQLSSATVNLLGSGSIVGLSQARGMDARATWDPTCGVGCTVGGNAFSGASGVSSGRHDVTITAYAAGGATTSYEDLYLSGGYAEAIAYGKSNGGVVTVKADAVSSHDALNVPAARATAINTAAGGSSFAEARHVALTSSRERFDYSAAASAASVGAGGARALASGQGDFGDLSAEASATGAMTVRARATRYGFYNAEVESRASVGGAVLALPALDGRRQGLSFVTGAPLAADMAPLLLQQPALAAGADWRAAGVMGAGGAFMNGYVTTEAAVGYNADAGRHLLLGLFAPITSAPGMGWTGLDFSVSNNGVPLFARSFSGEEFVLFFNNHLLDLGEVGAGAQNLLISSSWQVAGGAFQGFHYLVGISAVSEPGTWPMMALGLAGVLLLARRRGRAARPAGA